MARKRFIDDDAGFKAWVNTHHSGVAVNTWRRELTNTPVAHDPRCRTFWNTGYQMTHNYAKSCFDSLDEAHAYFALNGVKIKLTCRTCKVINSLPTEVIDEYEARVNELLTRPDRGHPKGQKKPKRVNAGPASVYVRDPEVGAYVKRRAKGTCEACQLPAPFKKRNGIPFLEVHHVRGLAEGGADTYYNAVAVCPNCHRHLHHGSGRKKLRARLYRQVPELRRE